MPLAFSSVSPTVLFPNTNRPVACTSRPPPPVNHSAEKGPDQGKEQTLPSWSSPRAPCLAEWSGTDGKWGTAPLKLIFQLHVEDTFILLHSHKNIKNICFTLFSILSVEYKRNRLIVCFNWPSALSPLVVMYGQKPELQEAALQTVLSA